MSETGSRLRRRTVLTIDDSQLIRTIVARHLEGSEFTLAGAAHDGEEGTMRFMEFRPDVVLLDLVMPGASGRETLRRLRTVQPDACVVIVSSVGTEEAVRECLEDGATSFLQKPFDRESLLRVLRTLPAGAPPGP